MTDATLRAGDGPPPSGGPMLDHLHELAEVQDTFLASIPEVDPAVPVPWCGSWRVRDLVVHLAGVHHRAASQASGAPEVPLDERPSDLEALYRTSALHLRRTLSDLGPHAVGATMLGPGPASFWRRRQLHETLVHLWDLRTAGDLPVDAPPPVWADTVDEVVTVMQPRQVRLGRMAPLQASLLLDATDVARTWVLGEGDPAARVSGTAEDLALLLWRRTRGVEDGSERLLTAVQVEGDPRALRDALAQPLTP